MSADPAEAVPPRKRIALVIGSGSVKCAAAIGMQSVLKREGFELDMVVGCSAGAMYAAVMASGHDTDTAARMTKELWTKEVAARRNTRALLQTLAPRWMRFDKGTYGLRDDRLIMKRLQTAFGDSLIEELPTPLHITATDLSNGELVVLSSGRVVDALRASIALPFAFSPWKVGDKLLIDGFLSDPLPIGVAIRQGANVIVAAGFESPYQSSIHSAGRFAFQLSAIMSNNLLKSNYAFHSLAHHSEIIPMIPRFEQRVRLFDTEKIPYIIEAGERAAEEQLPYLRELMRQSPEAVAHA
ncbi:patatin-like phospholipase family protein [Variovorax sp. J22P168]|uniref:patatin-like phospholipase family protein n=1 Tax=Variovorax jilinensis TaxID=3053513 RepID=UPI002577688C|nr:patatin-like phospholipase family protein [Variovorax sp. J22P168]MDM0014409.1 patatin-like phospholipase family protein [Variovorax sp. J22P168]